MQQNIDRILRADALPSLIQADNFIGWIYSLDYDSANVITNDLWKARALGVPHNSFLIAASFNPDEYSSAPEADKEAVLLRVVGSARLPQDIDLVQTKIDHYRRQQNAFEARQYDDLTLNELQFGGLECRVLGTFYVRDGELRLGSDLESFSAAARLNVFRPRGRALELIVNYVDPIRRQATQVENEQLGFGTAIEPFRIGAVRYTSTDRLHRVNADEQVPVRVQPSDYLARRTAVLGMTRTGKSNMIKQIAAVVRQVSNNAGVPVGQLIYDINGEYASANVQDQGALSEVFSDTVRYRMLPTPGFRELQNNFFTQLQEGFNLMRELVLERRSDPPGDLGVFLNMSLDEPDPQEQSAHRRWQRRVAAYRALLVAAGFDAPEDLRVRFDVVAGVRQAVDLQPGGPFGDPRRGLTPRSALDWFLALREANRPNPLAGSSGRPWVDNEVRAMLNLMASRGESNTFIRGWRDIAIASPYHSARRQQEIGQEIYDLLQQGRIVILDLSLGNAELRGRISQRIARHIFQKSMATFVEGETPPHIMIYVEEAHNLIGKGAELTETWPRLAKEGAKYRIGMVYATQEVSSVHENILANTENWFVSHLNNENEIRVLSRFYDFGDFSKSLIRAQDVGFTRVKTLSGPVVVPVQIDRFDPAAFTDGESAD